MSDSQKATSPPGSPRTTVKWDDSKMQTTYANVVNAASTREEVAIFFGTNQTWNVTEDRELVVQLTDRIVLNPYAAKRLTMLLTRIIQEYEKRFGGLHLEATETSPSAQGEGRKGGTS
jgi:hypothetical protein